ncbi:MAG: dihydrofolate reductase [Chitinophagales bacterium]|nr:dihydrofolate reductase [Chitinophagales bacterium]MDW8428528.1 dihydrofolate reductase [Chitinophagales bacterium]
MIITIIVAASQNGVIGRNNRLPWHLPADLKRFKQITVGHHIIMGRNTFESIGRPLPKRVNIVVTRQPDYQAHGCVVAHSLQEALEYARRAGETECFIIGGGDLIQAALVWADRILLTRVFHDFEGDTFLPQINEEDWELISEERHLPDAHNPYAYAFFEYRLAHAGAKSARPSKES